MADDPGLAAGANTAGVMSQRFVRRGRRSDNTTVRVITEQSSISPYRSNRAQRAGPTWATVLLAAAAGVQVFTLP